MSQFVGPSVVYDGTSQTVLTSIYGVGAYPFQQYADDDDIQSFFEAQNDFAQGFLNWFVGANLPIYTGGIVSGSLLDWVGQGVYGIMRPSVTLGTTSSLDATNQPVTNTLATNARKLLSNEMSAIVNDDIYRRVLTWNLYKGDGFVFNVEWLKRRVYRFMMGVNGVDFPIDQEYTVGVSVSNSVFTITISDTTGTAQKLAQLIAQGNCNTPIQATFAVVVVGGLLLDDGGTLDVEPGAGYPTSPSGLAAGALWSNGGEVTVVPGVTPNSSAPAVYFGSISAASLLTLGGGNLPLSPGSAGSLQLWNNGGPIGIS